MQSTTPTIQSASLHFREGNSDKEYHAAIEPEGEGYIMTFSYDRRDETLTVASNNGKPVVVGINAYIKPGS
jgi:bifunctional non-homologous end joining protein LigD